jgi:L-proline amide hydrolase
MKWMSLDSREGRIAFRDGETWYRITGDLDGRLTPLIILHGGPGAAHDYLDRYQQLASNGRAVINYDQFGCGLSTHCPARGADFWTVQLFLDELDALLSHLGIGHRYHVLGQSWGGMLAAEHAVRQPSGLRGLVIANSPASMHTWISESNRLRTALPPDVQATLLRHEAAGTTSDPAYEQATHVFYERHLCRVVPFPEEVQRSFAAIAADPTVYHTMNGPNEFHVTGSLRDWTIEDRLPDIRARTLVISGRHDEATEACVRPYAERIHEARRIVFENSSHMPHVEETAAVMETVAGFLAPLD